MKYFILVACMLGILACDRGPKTPEGLIKMFVTDLSSKKVEKSYFEDYTTGKLWDSVKDLEQEDFDKFANSKKVKNPRLKILNKNCTGDSCTLTYVVSYLLGNDEKGKFASEVKKVAVLSKEGDIWKISEVSNVKTYLEGTTAIEIGPEDE